MNLLPFENLKPGKPRTFVPEKIDLGDWSLVAPLYDQLDRRASECKTVADLERWLLDWGELCAALDQDHSERYIAMTCHTDSPEAEKAYLHVVENVQPQLKPREFKLAQLYTNHPLRASMPRPRYEIFDRNTALQVELFRPENVPLETEEARLCQQYQKISGALTVQFRGEEKTLVQMGRYLEEPDRPLRQETWELVAKRRMQECEKMEEIFDDLVRIRQQIAKNAGFSNYVDYAFRSKKRFDYTPQDCFSFHDAIEKEVMPAVRETQSKRLARMALPALRPWDLKVDPQNRKPLHPFEKVDGMVAGTQRVFNRMDKDLADEFKMMHDLRLLDLDNRKGKAPGGYQSTLAESRLPFIFMNAVGMQRDVETILHEAGHAFHALAFRAEDLYAYRDAPIEFCEVASMSMELLGNEFIEEFYDAPEARRARHDHLQGVVEVFPWIATVDAFQHWVYSNPGHSRAERRAAWERLMDRFGGNVDWSGYENVRGHLWHRQLHIFLYPFYYVEYGIAQLGALQVWANSRKDSGKALADYKSALELGNSRPLPELFAAAGCKFEFTQATMKPLMNLVRSELSRLS
jgi:oligoendopeptidase F